MSFISKNTARRVLFARALEPRFMLDGAALATAIDAAPPPAEAPAAETAEQNSTETLVASLAPTDPDAGPTGSEIVSGGEITFVDSGIENFEQLIRGLPEGMEVIIIDSTRDGISQISEALAGRSGLSAIHIVSHGDDGTAQLGNSLLSAATIDGFAAQIAGWGDALSVDADILFYGCNLAATADGENLVEQLADLTGADIAASSDITGAAAQDGNWDLEYASGSIETALPFSAESLAAYEGTLLTIDLYDATQTVNAAGVGVPVANTVNDPQSILSFEREISITQVDGTASSIAVNDPGALGNVLFQNGNGNSTVVITYDGVGAAGFTPVDMTEGGTQITFLFSVLATDFPTNITMEARSGVNSSNLTLSSGALIVAATPLAFQFANFNVLAGAGVDFTVVDTLIVSFASTNALGDMRLDFLNTSDVVIPPPGTPPPGPPPTAPPLPVPDPPSDTPPSNIIQQFGNGTPNANFPDLPSIIIDDFLTLEDSALYIGHSVNDRGDSIDNQYGANSVAIIKSVDPTEAIASTTGAQYASVANVIIGGGTGDSSVANTNPSSSSIGNTTASIGSALSNIAPSAGGEGEALTPEELEILRQAQEQAEQPETQTAPVDNSDGRTPPVEGAEQAPKSPNANGGSTGGGASLFPENLGVPGLSTQMETVAAEFGLRRDGLLAAFSQTRTAPGGSEMKAA